MDPPVIVAFLLALAAPAAPLAAEVSKFPLRHGHTPSPPRRSESPRTRARPVIRRLTTQA